MCRFPPLSLALVVTAALAEGGCGSSSSATPTSPTTPQASAPTPTTSGAASVTAISINVGKGVPDSERVSIEAFLRNSQDALSRIYGERSDRIHVGVYSDIEEMIQAYLSFNGSSGGDGVREMFTRFPGFTAYRAIWRGLWGVNWTQDTWNHEYTHILQWELSNNARGGRAPRWLEEGNATHAEIRLRFQFTTEQWRSYARQSGPVSLVDIEGMRIFDSPSGVPLGGLAAELLRLQYGGDAAMMVFWRELARSSWPQAFQAAFGVTPSQFYEAFERFR